MISDKILSQKCLQWRRCWFGRRYERRVTIHSDREHLFIFCRVVGGGGSCNRTRSPSHVFKNADPVCLERDDEFNDVGLTCIERSAHRIRISLAVMPNDLLC